MGKMRTRKEASQRRRWFFARTILFIFLIRDIRSGSLLFAGRLTDPRASSDFWSIFYLLFRNTNGCDGAGD
jgi:hypothetical protein